MGPIIGLRELISMLLRRAPLIAAILSLGIVGTLYIAMSLPRTYQAITVIQVEPSLLGRLDQTGPDQNISGRLRLIQQRLTARDNLGLMIERHHLFDDNAALSQDEQIALLRTNITIEVVPSVSGAAGSENGVSALLVTARTGNAETAADLANDLAEQIIAGNRSAYEQRHNDLVHALQAEDTRLSGLIAALQAEADAYAKANAEARPENTEILATERIRVHDQQFELTRALQALDRERLALEVGEPASTGSGTRTSSLVEQLGKLEIEVVQVRRTLGQNHPETKRLEERIAALRQGQEREIPAAAQRQIDLINTQEAVLVRQNEELDRRVQQIDAAITASPDVGARLSDFERQRRRLEQERDGISERLVRAELDSRLIANEHGERMVILERAQVPEYPVSSDRRRVAVLGAAASIALALLAAFGLELANPVLRTARQVERALGVAPIAVSRYRPGPAERRSAQLRLLFTLAILAAGASAAWYIVMVRPPG